MIQLTDEAHPRHAHDRIRAASNHLSTATQNKTMLPRKLKIHQHPAAKPTGRHPLLFIHGGYTNSYCWQHHWIPFLNQLGYDCYALDLSGHGDSEGREHLSEFGLSDYAEDLAQAVATLPSAPVLIGHSMGTLVAQRYLANAGVPLPAGVAFLSPVPPTGTSGSASRLALLPPALFPEMPNVLSGDTTEHSIRVMAEVYFAPGMAHDEVEQFLHMVQDESDHAVTEMAALPFMPMGRRPDIPALVMGGSADEVFPASMLFFTAMAWKAKSITVEGSGHMLMLDPQWAETAKVLADWIDTIP
jgi:pimeloyl-ACP methyl ester carboxylesterase